MCTEYIWLEISHKTAEPSSEDTICVTALGDYSSPSVSVLYVAMPNSVNKSFKSLSGPYVNLQCVDVYQE